MNDRIAGHTAGKYPDSWYAATTPLLPALPSLQGEETADVCVIGGGYTGLSTALHLKRKGYDVVLLEAERVGWGASAAMVGMSVPANGRIKPVSSNGSGWRPQRPMATRT